MRITDDDGAVRVSVDETTVFRYRTDTDASKPHADVLALPPGNDDRDGRNLVLTAPHDHAWHLGVFFCQKMVDGLNCWESEDKAAEDSLHGYATSGPYEATSDGDVATVTHEATWVSSDGEALLDDERTIHVGQPTERGYFLTWEQTLEALGSDRNLSSETVSGHYSGLSLRLRRSLGGGTVRVPDTAAVEDKSWVTGQWCDYSGHLDGQYGTGPPPSAGVTMFSPVETRWFTMTEPFGFLAANPTYHRVRRLPEGESLTWCWGLWVHRDEPDTAAIEDAQQRYREWRASDAV